MSAIFKLEVIAGRWSDSWLLIDLYINSKRPQPVTRKRWTPTKKYNYIFDLSEKTKRTRPRQKADINFDIVANITPVIMQDWQKVY